MPARCRLGMSHCRSPALSGQRICRIAGLEEVAGMIARLTTPQAILIAGILIAAAILGLGLIGRSGASYSLVPFNAVMWRLNAQTGEVQNCSLVAAPGASRA